MRLVTGTELKQIEAYAIEKIKLPSITLMERAALKVYEYIIQEFPKDICVLVVAGVGNNGADGIAIARMLHIAGRKVALKIIGNQAKATEEFKLQYEIYNNVNGHILYMKPDYEKYHIIVDALFGIGITRAIDGDYREVIEEINNKTGKTVISVDMPSGVNADTGKIMGVCIKADITVTFSCMKVGMMLPPGNMYTGKVIISDIGIPDSAYEGNTSVITYRDKCEVKLPQRSANGNKGTFGKLLIVAGSYNMSGAAYLCAKAAYRMGTGLVRIVTTSDNREVLQKMLPEAVLVTYNDEDTDILEAINWADAIVVGPGIGKSKSAYSILEQVMESNKKIVIDADGLNLISENDELNKKLGNNMIITPHIGEMSRLCGKSIDEIKDNILCVATEYAGLHNIIVVLKDAKTVVTDGNIRYINSSGNDGMATAGSGDVLAGMVGSLYAVDNNAFNSAINAVYLHGVAGDLAAEKLGKAGVMASDIANIVNETLM